MVDLHTVPVHLAYQCLQVGEGAFQCPSGMYVQHILNHACPLEVSVLRACSCTQFCCSTSSYNY